MIRRLALPAALVLSLLAPAAAHATITGVLAGETASGGAIPCATQSDGVRVCHGDMPSAPGGTDLRLKSFDGTPLEVYVILPPVPAGGSDGPYPVVVQSHGWGGSANGPTKDEYYGPSADALAKGGDAVLQLTARGFGDSCGSLASRMIDPAETAQCTSAGYIRLDDARYEARDVQYALGLLADQGVIDPARIGVTGESYGGGVSLELATLRDRIMNADGSTSPWTSPHGTPLSVTAAAPVIPWSDLVASLMPNGRTNDYSVTSPTADLSPIGVEKQSFVSGLYALGHTSGYYAPPGTNAQADLTAWFTQLNAGEPYDGNPLDTAVVDTIAQFHSPYYMLDGAYGVSPEQPAPLLIANGFDDDLFPVDEALRYVDLERTLYPNAPVSTFDGDFGHARAQNKSDVEAALSSAIQQFFAFYLNGQGTQPASSATAYTQTCPKSAPSGGPFTASTFQALTPGAVTDTSTTSQTVLSTAGDGTIAKTIDPIVGGGACATVSAADQGTGVATYRFPAASGGGYTLLGSPTVAAYVAVSGTYPELAARLWDVDPQTNSETLVARTVYRFAAGQTSGLITFQLHPGAWHFDAGHVAKLELLGQDAPYARASNGAFQITLQSLAVQLPVHEAPGSAPNVTPPAQQLTPPPPSPASCHPRPSSRISRHRTRARRGHLFLAGTARETACVGVSAAIAAREQVRHVWVAIYRRTAGGRCRYVVGHGRLTRPLSCRRPREYRARGTTRWTLRLRLHLAPGVYTIRSDAVDGLHRHQRHSGASVQRIRVR